ncbi:MAG: hypothetical protein JW759_09205 [Candidatus Coatesbacteria bacterium]|nr:hypothetical protein [Candidatus Coatesbacteria bacterium]
MLPNIFTIDRQRDIGSLTPETGVRLFGRLLYAEAMRLGLPRNKIDISDQINLPDGGVDASVRDWPENAKPDLIKPGRTVYQIKTGQTFQPWQEAKIKNELFGGRKASKNSLRPGIKEWLDSGATYVLVCFGHDLGDRRTKAEANIRDLLVQCGYENPTVEVWGQDKLELLLAPFPSLVLRVKGKDALELRTHASWSQDDDMQRYFAKSEDQEKAIAGIQEQLRRSDGAVHVRVLGEPGVGKTRLALKATREDDLEPLVIYFVGGQKFLDSELMTELLAEDNLYHVLLVIDECDEDARSRIWNQFKHKGPRIKLVTIYNEEDFTSGDIVRIDAPSLPQDQIAEIIESYGLPKEHATRWSELCGGSPRVAHVIGYNLKENPDDVFREPDTVRIWERYIAGYGDPERPEAQRSRRVLEYLSLFKRFGYGRDFVHEGQHIASMVQSAYGDITGGVFDDIISKLKGRKILQGETTLYITPKALQIKLWCDWWEKHGHRFDFEGIVAPMPGKLQEWFLDMFKYAKESATSSRVVRQLLGSDGLFQKSGYLRTRLGASFFLALSEAEPEAALSCLKRTVGIWGKEELLQFSIGRRQVVWALEKIVFHRQLFSDAARLLLALGEAENERGISNNAGGIFASLFSAAYGAVAVTGAPPEERYPVLVEALDSASKERRMLGLRAIENGLSMHHSRMVGPEYQGLGKPLQPWIPKSSEDVQNVYRRLWGMLWERTDGFQQEEQQEAVKILLHAAFALVQYKQFSEMVTETVVELVKKPYTDNKKALESVSRILARLGERMSPALRKRWEDVRNELVGTGFAARLRRYVGIGLLVEDFDDKGRVKPEATRAVQDLAQEALENHELLHRELTWLVTEQAAHAYSFGYELSRIDQERSLLPTLLAVQANAKDKPSLSLLSGYSRFVFENNRDAWERDLDALAEDETHCQWLPALTWHSGLTDRAVVRVLSLSEQGCIPLEGFHGYGLPAGFRSISEDVFQRWIGSLLESSHLAAATAGLDLFRMYYLEKENRKALPQELTAKLLTHPAFFETPGISSRNGWSMIEYEWTEVGEAYVKQHPRKSTFIAKTLLRHIGTEGSIVASAGSQPLNVLSMILGRFPKRMSSEIVKHLGPPYDARSYHISEWLRGDDRGPVHEGAKPAIYLMNPDAIWDWVEGSLDERAWFLAYRLVPDEVFGETGKVFYVREVLRRYGDRDDVQRNLTCNFGCESWSGNASDHYRWKKDKLREFVAREDDPNVRRWAEEYMSDLDREIERHAVLEEREAF